MAIQSSRDDVDLVADCHNVHARSRTGLVVSEA